MTEPKQKSEPRLAERVALCVAARFGEYGFSDIRDKRTRRLLKSADTLVTTTRPDPIWWKSRRQMIHEEIEKLEKKKYRLTNGEKEALHDYKKLLDEDVKQKADLKRRAEEIEKDMPDLFAEFKKLRKRKRI